MPSTLMITNKQQILGTLKRNFISEYTKHLESFFKIADSLLNLKSNSNENALENIQKIHCLHKLYKTTKQKKKI